MINVNLHKFNTLEFIEKEIKNARKFICTNTNFKVFDNIWTYYDNTNDNQKDKKINLERIINNGRFFSRNGV